MHEKIKKIKSKVDKSFGKLIKADIKHDKKIAKAEKVLSHKRKK